MRKFVHLLSWILKGKTLSRAILNEKVLSEDSLNGIVIDLGGGGNSTYKKILKTDHPIINMDMDESSNPTVVGNLEEKFPFENNYANNIILFNALEHVYNYQHVSDEIYRVIKEKGKVLIYTPFLIPYHVFQTETFFIDDYFRYTQSAYEKIFYKSGFKSIKIEPIGGLFLVIYEYIGYAIPIKFIRLLIFPFLYTLELIYRKVKNNLSETRYPLSYYITLIK